MPVVTFTSPCVGSPKNPQKLCHLSTEKNVESKYENQKIPIGISSGVRRIFISPSIVAIDSHATNASKIQKQKQICLSKSNPCNAYFVKKVGISKKIIAKKKIIDISKIFLARLSFLFSILSNIIT